MSGATPQPVERRAPAPPITLRLLISVTATWTVAQMSYYAQTQLLGPIMRDFGKGEEALGWMFGAEIFAFALTALAVAGPLARLSRVRVALAGGLLVVVANVASAYVTSYPALIATRWAVGMGAALAGSAGSAAAASALGAQRVFAIVSVSWGLMSALQFYLLPFATEFGSDAGFLALAGATLLLMPLFVWLLPPRPDPGARPSLLAAPNRRLALIAMLALFLYEAGQGGVFVFMEQIGLRSGLDEKQIGSVLGATALVGLAGGALAAWMGSRFGHRGPISIGLALNVLAAVALALNTEAVLFVALSLLWTAVYLFVVPYLMGMMAALDDLGRWVVAVDALWWLGDAAGPAVAGSLVERSGYGALALFPLLTGAVCAVLILGVLRQMYAGRGLAASESDLAAV